MPPEKIPSKKSLRMPLSANLFGLESSIIMRAKRATNQNKAKFFFFFRGVFVRGILSGNQSTHLQSSKKWVLDFLLNSPEGIYPITYSPDLPLGVYEGFIPSAITLVTKAKVACVYIGRLRAVWVTVRRNDSWLSELFSSLSHREIFLESR